MRNYLLGLWHGDTSFVQGRYIKFSDTAPYADGTPQYKISDGVWVNMVVDPGGGWRLTNAGPGGQLELPNGTHFISFRDGNGSFLISIFILLSTAARCLSREIIEFDAPANELRMATKDPETFQEYILGTDPSTPINNDPIQIFALSSLPISYTLTWVVTGGGACVGTATLYTNSESAPSPSAIAPGQIGLKIPWQYWLPLIGVPGDFFDETRPNNGQNLNSANYSDKQGYEVKVAILARVRKDNVDTIYQHKSQQVKSIDFAQEPPAVDNWSACEIETFNSNGDSLGGGLLLNGEVTTIKITFTPVGVIDINDFYGIARLQETEQPGYDIWESSTVEGIALGSPLGPATNSDVGGNLVVECDTVPANMGGSAYTVSGKIDLRPVAVTGDYKLLDYSSLDYS